MTNEFEERITQKLLDKVGRQVDDDCPDCHYFFADANKCEDCDLDVSQFQECPVDRRFCENFVETEVRPYVAALYDKIAALERERDGEVWYWLGDGHDHPETLCCPILIDPQDMVKILGIEVK